MRIGVVVSCYRQERFLARTVAARGEGLPEVLERIRAHGVWLRAHGGLERKARERAKLRFHGLLAEEASRRALQRLGAESVESLLQAIAQRRMDPYAAVAEALRA